MKPTKRIIDYDNVIVALKFDGQNTTLFFY